MDPALPGHLFLQKGINETMTGGLHFGAKGLRGDDEPEMCLTGSASLHCFVVGVEVRIVMDLKRCRIQSRSDL